MPTKIEQGLIRQTFHKNEDKPATSIVPREGLVPVEAQLIVLWPQNTNLPEHVSMSDWRDTTRAMLAFLHEGVLVLV